MMFIRAEPDGAEFGVPSLLAFTWPRKHREESVILSVCSV
jgi:hypothetical protein